MEALPQNNILLEKHWTTQPIYTTAEEAIREPLERVRDTVTRNNRRCSYGSPSDLETAWMVEPRELALIGIVGEHRFAVVTPEELINFAIIEYGLNDEHVAHLRYTILPQAVREGIEKLKIYDPTLGDEREETVKKANTWFINHWDGERVSTILQLIGRAYPGQADRYYLYEKISSLRKSMGVGLREIESRYKKILTLSDANQVRLEIFFLAREKASIIANLLPLTPAELFTIYSREAENCSFIYLDTFVKIFPDLYESFATAKQLAAKFERIGDLHLSGEESRIIGHRDALLRGLWFGASSPFTTSTIIERFNRWQRGR